MSTPGVRTRGTVIQTGVHRVLMAHNVMLLIIGVTMVIIGHRISLYTRYMTSPPSTNLAYLAFMPVAIGVAGVTCTSIGNMKLLFVWCVYAMLTCVGSYCFYVQRGYFTQTVYGVTLKIYNYCNEVGHVCTCYEPGSVVVLSTQQSCSDIRHVTSAYLCQMFLLTVTLAITIICCFLVLISYLISTHCADAREEEETLLASGVQSTPTIYRSHQTSVFMTDMTPSGQPRTCLSLEEPTGKTTL